jgi:selenocysteine lyase/cysteine desulfurase
VELKGHFSRFWGASPAGRLHVAAHSHHPWPDVSFTGHKEAWTDAAALADDKWEKVFGEVLPEAAAHIARRLGVSDPAAVAFGPSTHALLVRLLSSLPQPLRVLTTDAEFHSWSRQARRLEEDDLATVERVPAEPFTSFPERFAAAARRGGHDLVFFSHVHFNSGYVTPDLAGLVEAVPVAETYVVVDGYHSFMAMPVEFGSLERRAFFTAGGYKYAMAGEGACFLVCPPGYAEQPVDTGWFAGFSQLAAAPAPGRVPFAPDGSRFLGGTFDPTPLYRLNAVQRWLDSLGIDEAAIHGHVGRLQGLFLDRLAARWQDALLPAERTGRRGNFLTFRRPDAGELYRRLHDDGVITDCRDDRLRIGFGLYHDESDVDELLRRLKRIEN